MAIEVSLRDDKYLAVIPDEGRPYALCYDEPWRELTGDNFVLALIREVADQRAVIEAAKAFVPVAQDGSFSVAEWDRRFVRLADAVEALQEVE